MNPLWTSSFKVISLALGKNSLCVADLILASNSRDIQAVADAFLPFEIMYVLSLMLIHLLVLIL